MDKAGDILDGLNLLGFQTDEREQRKSSLENLLKDPLTKDLITQIGNVLGSRNKKGKQNDNNEQSDAKKAKEDEEELLREIKHLEKQNTRVESEIKRISSQQKQMRKMITTDHPRHESVSEESIHLCNHDSLNGVEQIKQSLESLEKSVESLDDIYKPISNALPSSTSTVEYFASEELFNVNLTKYTKKQFFEGIAELTESRNKSKYEFLDVSRPETYLVAGDSESEIQEQCEELNRLQDLYVTSEKERIIAQCAEAISDSALAVVKSQLSFIKSGRLHEMRVSEEGLHELESKIYLKKEKLTEIFENGIVPILEELKTHQSTKILRGNYDLKIARQEYFTSKQNEVINQLISQCARYEFLFMLYEIEANSFRDSHHLLNAIQNLLEEEQKTMRLRLNTLQTLTDPQTHDTTRETIDSRDITLQTINDLIVSPTDKDSNELFLSFSSLQKSFSALLSRIQNREKEINSLTTSHLNKTEEVKEEISACLDLLHNGFNQEDNLSELVKQLQNLINSLEKSLTEVVKDVQTKKKEISSDPLKSMERNIFAWFFNDPNRLRRQFAELKSRIETMSTSQ